MDKIVISDQAALDLKAIDPPCQRIIKAKLLILAENSVVFKKDITRIGGPAKSLYRLRVGSYRVIFRKEEGRLVILVVRIGHRKDIYLVGHAD